MQALQDVAVPPLENDPAAHDAHAVPKRNCPGAQVKTCCVHVADPAADVYPASHAVQLALPDVAENVLAGHWLHEALPAFE